MKLTKEQLTKEVDTAIKYAQDIITDSPEMDVDDIQHLAEQIKRALMRVKKELL